MQYFLQIVGEFLRTPSTRSSTNTEILRKSPSSKSQRIATVPRPVCSETARISARPGPNGDRMSLFRSSEPGDCYRELPRIPLPRTQVNRGAPGLCGPLSIALSSKTRKVRVGLDQPPVVLFGGLHDALSRGSLSAECCHERAVLAAQDHYVWV